jgi:hypothetical protein
MRQAESAFFGGSIQRGWQYQARSANRSRRSSTRYRSEGVIYNGDCHHGEAHPLSDFNYQTRITCSNAKAITWLEDIYFRSRCG